MSDIFADYSFGGWLKRFRLKREMGLRATAGMLEMDSGNYSKIESSKVNPPSLKEIERIVKVLGLEPSEREMLVSTAYSYHLALFKKKWEQS